jgi:teichoic acid transport system ATP-binding protein
LICVTHSPGLMETCDRSIWLHHGELVMDGPSAEVVPAYVNYMAAPENGLPTATVKPVNKVRMLRTVSRARARRG